MTINETVNRFNSFYELNRFSNENRSDYSCGSTSEVGSHGHLFIVQTKCDSMKTVRLLLNKLKECGYSIIDPKSDETSLTVFMKRKVENKDNT